MAVGLAAGWLVVGGALGAPASASCYSAVAGTSGVVTVGPIGGCLVQSGWTGTVSKEQDVGSAQLLMVHLDVTVVAPI